MQWRRRERGGRYTEGTREEGERRPGGWRFSSLERSKLGKSKEFWERATVEAIENVQLFCLPMKNKAKELVNRKKILPPPEQMMGR